MQCSTKKFKDEPKHSLTTASLKSFMQALD